MKGTQLTEFEATTLRRIFAAGGTVDFKLSQGRARANRLRKSTMNVLLDAGLVEFTAVHVNDPRSRVFIGGRWVYGMAWRAFGTAAGARALYDFDGHAAAAAREP